MDKKKQSSEVTCTLDRSGNVSEYRVASRLERKCETHRKKGCLHCVNLEFEAEETGKAEETRWKI